DEHHGAPGDEAAVRAAAATVPMDLQRRLASIVVAEDWAASEVYAALGTTSPTAIRYLARAYLYLVPSPVAWSTNPDKLALLDKVDVNRIADAAALLAKTIESADLQSVPEATFAPFEIPTPLGHVIVHDASNDTYADGSSAADALLLFDLGGDD